MTTLYLFDLDGTLISSYMDRPDRDYHAWAFLPNVVERVHECRQGNSFVGLVTNQGGVAFGKISEDDVRQKLAGVANGLGYAHVEVWAGAAEPEEFSGSDYGYRGGSGQLGVWACYADPRSPDPRYQVGAERRKPSGAMIREAVAAWSPPHAAGNLNVVYVGDRPEDQAAAADAGVEFVWAHEFFEGTSNERS